MFDLDDTFFKDLQLDGLDATAKEQLLEQFREVLELRISSRIVEQLSDEQLDEFESHAPSEQDDEATALKKQQAAFAWLEQSAPDYTVIVQEEIENLKQEITSGTDNIIEKL